MSHLPPAQLVEATAIQDRGRLILYLEGLTDGFGGRFEVLRSDARVYPPAFEVYEVPGNPGINPDASPQDVPTEGAFAFDGRFRQVQLWSAGEPIVLRVLPAREEGPEAAAPGVRKLAGGEIPVPFRKFRKAIERLVKGGDGGIPTPFAEHELELGWHAVHNFMPPGKPKLTVTGVLLMPTPGWTLTLTEQKPQGINPAILLLRLRAKPPTGPVIEPIRKACAVFEKETSSYYSDVMVLGDDPDDPVVAVIPVERVS
jgi:hypothetical protein